MARAEQTAIPLKMPESVSFHMTVLHQTFRPCGCGRPILLLLLTSERKPAPLLIETLTENWLNRHLNRTFMLGSVGTQEVVRPPPLLNW